MKTLDDRASGDQLDAHLRRTLHAVAETVTDDTIVDTAVPGSAAVRRPSTRRRALALVALVACGVLGLVGWKAINPDAIVRIPTESAIMSGSAEHGGEWWLFPAQVMSPGFASECDPLPASVIFVSAAANQPGDEMNAGGVTYGEAGASICVDPASYLANPARIEMGSMRLGPSNDGGDPSTAWGYFAAVHPTVSEIRVKTDDETELVVSTVTLPGRSDGPRFAGFTTPPDTETGTIELRTADGTTVLVRPLRNGG